MSCGELPSAGARAASNARAPGPVRALRALAPALCLAAVAFTAAGCPDSLGQLCPAGSQQAGLFNTTLTFVPDPSQCYYSTVDGGLPDASLAAQGPDAGPDTFTAAICSGFDGGAAVVYFALPADIRQSTLGDGGTFSYDLGSLVSGTACGCNIVVNEAINFQLAPATTGTVISVNADGGLPLLAGFTGTVVDQVLDGDDAGATCSCNLPCDLQYTLTATPY